MNTDFTEANRANGEARAGRKMEQQDFIAETQRPRRNAEMPGKTVEAKSEGRMTNDERNPKPDAAEYNHRWTQMDTDMGLDQK